MTLQQAYRGGFEGKPGWWLHFNYDEELVESFKKIVPARWRTWDEDNKRWWIASEAGPARLLPILPGLEAYLRQEPLL